MAHDWKEPKTSIVYLANGGHLIAAINGIAPEDDSGYVTVHGREVKVMPLPDLFRPLGYGEVVSITLQDGKVFNTVLQPQDYQHHVAWVDIGESDLALIRAHNPGDIITSGGSTAIIAVYETETGRWREMTDQEYEQERRVWSEDMKDMEQIKRKWREYRTEGDETPESSMSNQDDLSHAFAGIRSRLDVLASINESNILIPGGSQERYHHIIEEAYAALGLVETQVDELRTELEYQQKRLDELRDVALAEIVQDEE